MRGRGAAVRLAVLGCALALGAALTGCGGEEGGASGNVRIALWTNSSNPVYKDIVADFEKQNPDVDVQLTAVATNQYLQNLQVSATNRTLPDVFFEGLGATLAHQFIDAGRVLNLDEYARRENWDRQFLPTAVEQLKWKGSWWEVPHAVLGMGLFYRKDIFRENGIEVPTTFEELEAACAKLKAAGVTPISIGGKGSWMTMRFTDALIENFAGPEDHDALYTPEGDWTSPEVVRAFETLREWTEEEYFTKGFLSIDPGTNYVSWFQGRAAMVFEGPWEDATILAQDQDMDKFGFFPFPTSEEPRRLSTFSQGWMVSANTRHKEASVDLARFLTSTETLQKYADRLEGPLANVDVKPPENQPNQAAIKQLLTDWEGYLPTDQRFPQDVVNQFFELQDSVVAGRRSPAEAAAGIQAAKSE